MTMMNSNSELPQHGMSRRQLLKTTSCGFGYLAFAGLCQAEAGNAKVNPLAPKQPHFPAKAKRVIFLHMRGGPSQQDTFDFKPKLGEMDGKPGRNKKRKLLGSPYKFTQHGESGLLISELCSNVARHADDLCVLNGMHTDFPNHPEAMVQLHTGSAQFVRPSAGSWVLYGLGTENQNLPGFISISPPVINGGPQNYGSAFLPAVYQGSALGDIKTPVKNAKIGNIANKRLPASLQRDQLDFIQAMNRNLLKNEKRNSQLEGVIESYELAFRMQSELPAVMNLSEESKATQEMYGLNKPITDDFGRQCLLARRFMESGVRYVELCHEFWDHHKGLRKGLDAKCGATDQPIGALLTDLKQRGLLEDTLVIWGGEFGRTPDSAKRDGRDHNAKGYTMWMAGGGVKGGFTHGKTDPLGYDAVEGRVHLHDMHATMMHLLGLDHMRLTYRYAGRDFRLTDVSGNVVKEILA
jgi:hypothetical protein